MTERQKYDWLYKNTGYARTRGAKHRIGKNVFRKDSYWPKLWRDIKSAYDEHSCAGHLLDVGCGDGAIRELAAKDRIRVFGLDLSRYARANVFGESFRLPFSDKCVDAVVSIDVLEHIPEERIDESIYELARVSRKIAYVTISYREERGKVAEVGPLHITVRPPEWWRERIERFFCAELREGKKWVLRPC